MGPNGEKCATCYFAELWTDDESEEDPYFCRRFPPSAHAPKDDYKDTPMPIQVHARMWCGEWKERKP